MKRWFGVVLALVLVVSGAGVASATTRIDDNFIRTTGSVNAGTTSVDAVNKLHVEGNSVMNGTLNASVYQVGDYRTPFVGNISNASLSSFRTWTLPDATGHFSFYDLAQTWTALQSFGTNAQFDGSDVTTGTIPDARLSANVMLLDGVQTVSGAKTYNTGTLKVGGAGAGVGTLAYPNSGSSTTATFPANTGTVAELNLAQTWTALQSFGTNAQIDGSDVTTGTVADARLSANVMLLNGVQTVSGAKTFNPATLLVGGAGAGVGTVAYANSGSSTTATLPANTGTVAELNLAQTWTALQTFGTNAQIDGSDITTGTVADARLSANVMLLDGVQTVSGAKTFNAATLKLAGAGAGIATLAYTNSASNPTATFPANTGTVAELNLAQTFTALQSFGAGVSVSSAQSVLLVPTSTGLLPTAAEGALVYDGTTHQLKVGIGSTPAYDVAGTLAAAQTWSGANTFSAGTVTVSGGTSTIFQTCTSCGTDQKNWQYFVTATGPSLRIQAVNDANSVATDAIVIARGTATAVSNVQVATSLLVNSAALAKDEATRIVPTANIAGSATISNPGLLVDGSTVTYTGATGQTGAFYGTRIGAPTLTSATSATVGTGSSTFRIDGGPTCAGSLTCPGNIYQFDAAGSGTSRFGGPVIIGQTGTTNTARLSVTPNAAPTGAASQRDAIFSNPATTIAFATTAQTADVNTVRLGIMTYTNPSSGTVPNAATLKIDGVPVCSTNVVCTQSHSLWVAGGSSRFDADLAFHTNTVGPVIKDGAGHWWRIGVTAVTGGLTTSDLGTTEPTG